jgi:hypothetical protein
MISPAEILGVSDAWAQEKDRVFEILHHTSTDIIISLAIASGNLFISDIS